MIPFHKVLSRIPFEDLEALDDHIVRFTYPQPREVPAHWAMVLDPVPDVDRLEPDVLDRETVVSLLEGLAHALHASYEQGQGSALFETELIDEPLLWRDVLLDHYCRPQWLYTNGQRVFTVVVREQPRRYEVAQLPSLDSLHEFRTLHIRALPDAREVIAFGHFDGAEAHVLRALSQLQVRALPLRQGERRRMLLLQAAGSRPGGAGRSAISLYLAHVGGQSHLLEMQPGRRDAYTVLNELGEIFEDEVVQACATCSSFRFSGKSRDSSGGTQGFCRRRLEAARATGQPMTGMDVQPRYGTVVSVFDRCGAYEAIADGDREVPFCHQGGKGTGSHEAVD